MSWLLVAIIALALLQGHMLWEQHRWRTKMRRGMFAARELQLKAGDGEERAFLGGLGIGLSLALDIVEGVDKPIKAVRGGSP